MSLGYLAWWSVGEVRLNHDDLASAFEGTGVPLPSRPIPIDVFRRLTTTGMKRFGIGVHHTLDVTLAVVPASSDKMLTHHVVGTLKNNETNAVEMVRKVGEVVFYKPPRGQHARSRIRVVPFTGGLWDPEVAQFCEWFRREYDRGVKGAVDSQAIRRLIRGHLAAQGALYLGGPYFCTSEEQISGLVPLFDMLGQDSYLAMVAVEDSDSARGAINRGVERAVAQGHTVAPDIWDLVGEGVNA